MKSLIILAVVFSAAIAQAKSVSCKLIDNQSNLKIMGDLAALELSSDLSAKLDISFKYPNPNGFAFSAPIQSLTQPSVVLKPNVTSEGLTLKTQDAGAGQLLANVSGTGGTSYGPVNVNVTFACDGR
jgi:hypothetical protein